MKKEWEKPELVIEEVNDDTKSNIYQNSDGLSLDS